MGGQAVPSTQALVALESITKGSDVFTHLGGCAASLIFSAALSPEQMVGTHPGQWEFAAQAAFPLLQNVPSVLPARKASLLYMGPERAACQCGGVPTFLAALCVQITCECFSSSEVLRASRGHRLGPGEGGNGAVPMGG